MLRFDTLKIAFPNAYLTFKDYSAFIRFPSQKHVGRYNYYLANPCPGIISIRVGDTETVIEFSAKVLKADYPQLLSAATIEHALTNIVAASPLTFDVSEALRLAHVLKAHQTYDFTLSRPFGEYAVALASLHVNREYRLVEYKDETITYLQNATGPGREYLKFYNKAKEYTRPANAAYRETLTATEKRTVSGYFADKIRAESEYNTKRKLRQHFTDIHPDILLTDLLNSTCNPLATQFAEITKEAYAAIETPAAAKSLSFADTLSYKQAPAFAFLKEYGFDLGKIDARLKALKVVDRTASRERKKYAALLVAYKAHETDSPSVQLLHELKAAITIAAHTPNLADCNTETDTPDMADTPAVANHTLAAIITPPITIATDTPNLADCIPLTESDEDAAFFALLDSLHYEDEETAEYMAQRIY